MRILLVGLVVLAASGCLDASNAGAADGHYVNYRWGQSSQSCQNNVCTYGQNAKTFEVELRCDVAPTLSWDAKNWIHGSVTASVLDDKGTEVARHTVAANGKGSQPVAGEPGTWTLKGSTNNANGVMEIRLACV